MEEQKRLFEIIKPKIQKKMRLADEIEELLGVSTDTAYKRIKGETDLTFTELVTICRKYNVSMDEIIFKKSKQGALFHYEQIEISEQESCINYLQQLLDIILSLRSASEKEIICVAQVIPFYSFLKYPELTFFKLYVCYDVTKYGPITFSEYCNRLDKDRFLSLFEKVYQAQMFIPTKEIWSNETIDTTYKLIDYYHAIGAFENKKTALTLLDQFTQLLDTIKQWADNGYKGSNKETAFEQYVCSVDLGNALMLARIENHFSCTLRLNTINSISTDNELICSDINKWINDLIAKSIQISGKTAEKERHQFYKTAKAKIEGLVNAIK